MLMSAFTLTSIVISWLINFFLLKFNKRNFMDINKKPHAIHKKPVLRIGGMSVFIPFLLESFCIRNTFSIKILLPAVLVFGLGFVEDLKKDISPKLRLAFLLFISVFTIWLLGIEINTVGFLDLPQFISIPLTIVAIAGFTNAINIVDGLNGLASGISAIFLFFLGLTFYEYGNFDIASICFAIIGGIIGFLFFNFPQGRIFLGDGGAYFLGFMCAVLSIKLINFVPEVSPWFPLMLGAYPVWEVLFSAYRRLKKGKHPFSPDKLHFHTLLYYKLTRSNPKASIRVLLLVLFFSGIAFLFRTCTPCLIVEFLIFVIVYVCIYRRLVRLNGKVK